MQKCYNTGYQKNVLAGIFIQKSNKFSDKKFHQLFRKVGDDQPGKKPQLSYQTSSLRTNLFALLNFYYVLFTDKNLLIKQQHIIGFHVKAGATL
jgi:hypothetical protein